MIDVVAKLNLKPLTDFTDKAVERLSEAVRKTAFAIEGDAKILAPVDTGALRASIYTVTDRSSGFSSAVAGTSRPDQIAQEMPLSPSPLIAFVAVGMEYGIYLEYGTRHMAARPFMFPAAQQNLDFFKQQVADAVKSSKSEAGL